MHILVRLIVEAEDATDAIIAAETFADDLTGENGQDFDWYNFDGRWGKSEAYLIDSAEGKRLLDEGMQFQRNDFDEALEHVRYMLENYTDSQIYEEQLTDLPDKPKGIYYLSRYQFSKVGGTAGASYIYASADLWGGKVENERELEAALRNANREHIWIVPVDFHY
jgi:hypothetical protein